MEKLKNTAFTNTMTQLHLAYGDIVVWEVQATKTGVELAHSDDIPNWWFKYLKDVPASCYVVRSDDVSDFFATPIYHWKAPRGKPRPLQDSTFFVDGVALGQGARGFQMMMDTIEDTKSRRVFILAPRIKNEGQASPWIAMDQLSAWAQDAGVSTRFEKFLTSRYGGLLDLGRFGDGDD
jgi:hypothetical protein